MRPVENDLTAKLEGMRASLSSEFSSEISRYEEMLSAREQRRQEAIEQAARESQAKLDAMLELQVCEAEERQKRRKFWSKFVLGPTGALSVIIGALVAYAQATKPEVEPAITEASLVQKVEQIETEAALRFHAVERDNRALARELLRQRIQIAEGFEHLGKKIDAANPRAIDVPPPPSLQALRRDVDRVMQSPKGKSILEDEEDQLADMVQR